MNEARESRGPDAASAGSASSHPGEEGEPVFAFELPGLRALGRLAVAALLGLVVGLVGTVAHRGAPPWGLVLAVALTLSAAILARAIGGGSALAGYAGALILLIQLANAVRPGDDVLVVGDPLGYSWLALPLLMCAVAAFLPRRWFARRG